MIQTIPIEIAIGSFSLVGVLTGYIWNNQSKRIDTIIKTQSTRPCGIIAQNIESIKNDIEWIKRELDKK